MQWVGQPCCKQYLNISPATHKTHCISVKKIIQSILYLEIISVILRLAQPINTPLWAKCVDVIVKAQGTYSMLSWWSAPKHSVLWFDFCSQRVSELFKYTAVWQFNMEVTVWPRSMFGRLARFKGSQISAVDCAHSGQPSAVTWIQVKWPVDQWI